MNHKIFFFEKDDLAIASINDSIKHICFCGALIKGYKICNGEWRYPQEFKICSPNHRYKYITNKQDAKSKIGYYLFELDPFLLSPRQIDGDCIDSHRFLVLLSYTQGFG